MKLEQPWSLPMRHHNYPPSPRRPDYLPGSAESHARIVTGVHVTLSHPLRPDAGLGAAMARHWCTGTVAVDHGRLVVSSDGSIIMDLHPPLPTPLPGPDSRALILELPTPACLQLMIDADRCTDNLHGFWLLRLFTARAELLADTFNG
jgi:hypothetical protein